MNHETHIPPKQTETATQVRISSAHEDCRRPQGDPPPSQTGKKGTRRLTRSDRLKKRFEFLSVMRQGTRVVGRFICVDYKKAPRLRFGITASRKYGDSPERNRFKRIVREAFRLSHHLLPQDLELNIVPRQKAKEAKMGDVQNELLQLLKSC